MVIYFVVVLAVGFCVCLIRPRTNFRGKTAFTALSAEASDMSGEGIPGLHAITIGLSARFGGCKTASIPSKCAITIPSFSATASTLLSTVAALAPPVVLLRVHRQLLP